MKIKLFLLIFLLTKINSLEITEEQNVNPYPIPLEKEKVFKITNIDKNTTLELFFFKPTIVNQVDIYYYDSKNYLEQIYGWGYDYYKISSGLLFKSNFIKQKEDFVEKEEDIKFNKPLILQNKTILPYYIYVEKDVYFKYKIWTTNNTVYKWNEVLN